MMTRYTLILVLMCLALSSCDRATTARIQNDTKTPIKVKVCLTRSNQPISEQLKSYKLNNGRDSEVLFIDSAHLKITYRISPGTGLAVFDALASPPSYNEYDSIFVFSADTLRLLSRVEIATAMKKIDDRHWEISVKK